MNEGRKGGREGREGRKKGEGKEDGDVAVPLVIRENEELLV